MIARLASKRPARAAGELAQERGVVLVGDRSGRVAGGTAPVVAGAARARQRPLADERLGRADERGDRAQQQLPQIQRVAEQVRGRAVAALLDAEAP
jgi:hypothetical protein